MVSAVDQSISDEDCAVLAWKIKSEVYEPFVSDRRSIFLCGADPRQPNNLRSKVAEGLVGPRYSYYFDLIYPEEIFEDLLYSPQSRDLLSLENLLADSVDALVIIPESPGSLTELGAFVNNERLRKRIVCVVDKKFKKDKSFINRGPLQLIKRKNPDRVIYVDPSEMSQPNRKLRGVLLSMERGHRSPSDNISLLQVENFVLPAIYLLEPVTQETLIRLVANASQDKKNAYQITMTALTSLIKKRNIEHSETGYRLTKVGVQGYGRLRKQKSNVKMHTKTKVLDDLRLEILNFSLRKKRLKV